jgi:anthranilate phosphoribosyltransferase
MTEASHSFGRLLKLLVTSPQSFTPEDLQAALHFLFTPDTLHPAQIGAFLAALHITQIERKPDILATATGFLLEKALKAQVAERDRDFVVDIVGTGGDGHNTFNVSTTAAVVAAGAGARVIKVRSLTVLFDA